MSRLDLVRRAIDDLRPLPEVAQRILRIVGSSEPSTDELLVAVRREPGLTASVMELANSDRRDVPPRIADLSQAVAYLGASQVMRMAVTQCLAPYYRRVDGIDENKATSLWQHAVSCGVTAELLAGCTGMTATEPAFAAGMLHDIGRLGLAPRAAELAHELHAAASSGPRNYLEIEREILGLDHGAAGAMIAERWGLPQSLSEAVRNHHTPERLGSRHELTSLVHLADALSLQHSFGPGTEGLTYPVCPDALARVHISGRELDRVRLMALEELRQAEVLLNLPRRHCR